MSFAGGWPLRTFVFHYDISMPSNPSSHTHARASGHSRTPLHPRGPRRGTRRTNRTRTRRRSATSSGTPAPRARACVHSGRRHPARCGARPVQPRVAAGVARVGALLGRVEQVHGCDAALDEPVRGGGANLSVEEDERVARRLSLHTSDSVTTPGCEQRLCCRPGVVCFCEQRLFTQSGVTSPPHLHASDSVEQRRSVQRRRALGAVTPHNLAAHDGEQCASLEACSHLSREETPFKPTAVRLPRSPGRRTARRSS